MCIRDRTYPVLDTLTYSSRSDETIIPTNARLIAPKVAYKTATPIISSSVDNLETSDPVVVSTLEPTLRQNPDDSPWISINVKTFTCYLIIST